MQLTNVKHRWSLRDVFKHALNKDGMFDILFMSNVARDPIKTIAEYAGLELKSGNAIAGTTPTIPKELIPLEDLLWFYFVEDCACRKPNLPSPLSDNAVLCGNMTLYIWISFLRLPGQKWHVIKDRTTVWQAMLHSS